MSVEVTTMDHPTLLFDGYCNLCSGSVLAVIKRDPQAMFRFASLQSPLGRSLLDQHDLNPDEINSVVLIHEKSFSLKSDAVLDVFQLLGGFYRPLAIFKFLPTSFRNRIYDWIAKNRYVWFGKKDVCMIPTPELEDRFLT
jgi:predicted DCC family thiol-disulfide oxidoreductase YuxK